MSASIAGPHPLGPPPGGSWVRRRALPGVHEHRKKLMTRPGRLGSRLSRTHHHDRACRRSACAHQIPMAEPAPMERHPVDQDGEKPEAAYRIAVSPAFRRYCESAQGGQENHRFQMALRRQSTLGRRAAHGDFPEPRIQIPKRRDHPENPSREAVARLAERWRLESATRRQGGDYKPQKPGGHLPALAVRRAEENGNGATREQHSERAQDGDKAGQRQRHGACGGANPAVFDTDTKGQRRDRRKRRGEALCGRPCDQREHSGGGRSDQPTASARRQSAPPDLYLGRNRPRSGSGAVAGHRAGRQLAQMAPRGSRRSPLHGGTGTQRGRPRRSKNLARLAL